jgi:F-type H+-transporting ATPase subunit epsilon
MSTLHLSVVSQESLIYSGPVEQLTAMTTAGEVGIMPGHTALLGLLKPGELRFSKEGKEERLFISGGAIEVQPKAVTILADVALREAELDEEKILAAKEAAERKLAENMNDIDYATVMSELKDAITQLRLISKWKGQR